MRFSALYVTRRLAAAIVVLFVVISGTFLLSHTIPADPARAAAGVYAAPAQVRAVARQLGLDQSLWSQYLSYVGNVLRGNLGNSYVSRSPVEPQLAAAVPATLELVLCSFVVCAVLGVVTGMAAAWRPRALTTKLIHGTSILGTALPVFWFAIILQLVFAARLGWFPIEGRLSASATAPPDITGFYTIDALLAGQWATFGDAVSHLVLPVVSLVAWMLALTSRTSEKSIATELNRPYVQTAIARGVSSSRLLGRHVLRNALNPIITVLGLQFGWLLGGTMLVEVVFSWGGVGTYLYTALSNFDYPVIEGVTLVITATFVVVNLCVDLLYPVIDPRVRGR
jgi:ABC-type dipeptide/oligopeptide/nickel transport system permease component